MSTLKKEWLQLHEIDTWRDSIIIFMNAINQDEFIAIAADEEFIKERKYINKYNVHTNKWTQISAKDYQHKQSIHLMDKIYLCRSSETLFFTLNDNESTIIHIDVTSATFKEIK